jgi:hypothetical protein
MVSLKNLYKSPLDKSARQETNTTRSQALATEAMIPMKAQQLVVALESSKSG